MESERSSESAVNDEPRATVLIVDDSPKNLRLLGNVLNEAGYRVIAAVNGAQTLKILESRLPDIILLDVMMPEMDGKETCRRLKTNPKIADIPVVFLTAKAETEDVVEGFSLGAVDYVTKPFNSVELLARVRTHVELKRGRDELARLNVERKELLHVLCHDLATPFTSISTALQLIKSGGVDVEETLGELSIATDQGLEVIKLVRAMRSLEDEKVAWTPEEVDLKLCVTQSTLMLKRSFEEKDVRIVVEVPDGIRVVAEETSLVNSVLNNLLTNAIKFSYPTSTVEISAREDGDSVFVTVSDHGAGMPPDLLERAFALNKPTTRPGTNGERGTGFGLPLVKRFVESYGGSISIDSADEASAPDNHGTTVTLTFKKTL